MNAILLQICTQKIFKTNIKCHLPNSNTGSWLWKWPPKRTTQFERVRANLDQIVRQCPERGHWENGREEEYVPKLEKQLEIVIKCAL